MKFFCRISKGKGRKSVLYLAILVIDSNVDDDNVIGWIDSDTNDPGIEHVTYEEIVEEAYGMNF